MLGSNAPVVALNLASDSPNREPMSLTPAAVASSDAPKRRSKPPIADLSSCSARPRPGCNPDIARRRSAKEPTRSPPKSSIAVCSRPKALSSCCSRVETPPRNVPVASPTLRPRSLSACSARPSSCPRSSPNLPAALRPRPSASCNSFE